MVEPERCVRLMSQTINLADERLGAAALACSDDFFAPMARMLNPAEPEWRAGVYDSNGKWMDGWESRRRRGEGHDHCVVKLAGRCTLALLDIDTRHFTGNYPPFASVDACCASAPPDRNAPWAALLAASPLQGNQHNYFELSSTGIFTHLRLNIFPDGGVARLRAYGTMQPDWSASGRRALDLAAALNGGRALACSDEHYGSMHNLLLPGRGDSMADGWETRRRREPGYDWVILRLGRPGRIERIEVDTAHFKGNFPHEISVNASLQPAGAGVDLKGQSMFWPSLLAPQRLKADAIHRFAKQLVELGPVSHVRVNIHPDGGLSRVRCFGRPQP